MTKKNRMHAHVCLDRSGSMASTWDGALNGLNAYVRQLAETTKARVSVSVFDDESVDLLRDDVAAKKFAPVTRDEVEPRGMTPLFDAVGHAITQLDATDDALKALVILTDGFENASREHTKDSIGNLIQSRKLQGWLVTYLGTAHDSWAQAQSMGFDRQDVANYARGRERSAMVAMSVSHARFAKARCASHGALSDDERAAMVNDDALEASKSRMRRQKTDQENKALRATIT